MTYVVITLLCIICGMLAGTCSYLYRKLCRFDRELDKFGEALGRLAVNQTKVAQEAAKAEEGMEDRVAERLAKRMDDGFQKIMAWNPLDYSTFNAGGDS